MLTPPCLCTITDPPPPAALYVHARVSAQGVICDVRKPDVMRIAPAPLYNSFEDVRRFIELLAKELQ